MYVCMYVWVWVCVCVCEQKFRQKADLRRDKSSLAFDFWHVAWGKGLQQICRRFFSFGEDPLVSKNVCEREISNKIAVGAEKCEKKMKKTVFIRNQSYTL